MEESKQPLTEHLTELRKRILLSLGFIGVAFIVLFNYSEIIFEFLTFPLKHEMKVITDYPYINVLPKTPVSLVFLAPAEAFWMHLKVSFISALVLSLPLIFYQFWQFVSPGLLEKEKRYVVPFVIIATLLFFTGFLFCFIIVLPFAMTFLLGYKIGTLVPMLSVGNYIDFCLKFILAFGAIFELPLAIIFLTRMGIVTPATLSKNRKYAVLLAFVAAALLTPTPDAFNQTLMAIPIIVLYETGIVVSRLFIRKKHNV